MPGALDFPYERTTRAAKPRILFRSSDADTIVVEQPLRLVSCDTPEKADYAGKPEVSQPILDKSRERLNNNFYNQLPQGLRDYLVKKITNDAAQRHIDAGMDAIEIFEKLLSERLTLPDGKKRKIAVVPTGEMIDAYGRLLAYIAPWYANTQTDPLPPRDDPRRNTLNFDMIANGWAAFFPVYPSLPSNQDLNRTVNAADSAWRSKKGAWKKYGENLLLGYEFRMCIKLAEAQNAQKGVDKAFQRICIDLRDLSIVGKFEFFEVPPSHRLWVWEKDKEKAMRDLNLSTD